VGGVGALAQAPPENQANPGAKGPSTDQPSADAKEQDLQRQFESLKEFIDVLQRQREKSEAMNRLELDRALDLLRQAKDENAASDQAKAKEAARLVEIFRRRRAQQAPKDGAQSQAADAGDVVGQDVRFEIRMYKGGKVAETANVHLKAGQKT